MMPLAHGKRKALLALFIVGGSIDCTDGAAVAFLAQYLGCFGGDDSGGGKRERRFLGSTKSKSYLEIAQEEGHRGLYYNQLLDFHTELPSFNETMSKFVQEVKAQKTKTNKSGPSLFYRFSSQTYNIGFNDPLDHDAKAVGDDARRLFANDILQLLFPDEGKRPVAVDTQTSWIGEDWELHVAIKVKSGLAATEIWHTDENQTDARALFVWRGKRTIFRTRNNGTIFFSPHALYTTMTANARYRGNPSKIQVGDFNSIEHTEPFVNCSEEYEIKDEEGAGYVDLSQLTESPINESDDTRVTVMFDFRRK